MANAQPEPQRLLWIFARAELPNGFTETQKQHYEAGRGGALDSVEPQLREDRIDAKPADGGEPGGFHAHGAGLNELQRGDIDLGEVSVWRGGAVMALPAKAARSAAISASLSSPSPASDTRPARNAM
mgnify:CR=1 FL=1